MADRVLLVLAVFFTLCGCEQADLSPEESEKRGGAERTQLAPRLAPQHTPEPVIQEPPFDTTDELVGDFCHPENVPGYRVTSAEIAGNDLMPVLELVVATEATSEVGLTLIARDLKVSYAFHDALLVSFVNQAKPGEPESGEAQII